MCAGVEGAKYEVNGALADADADA